MAKFYFTKRAVEDLSSIWNYTFEVWSEEQADKYYRMLIEVCRKLTENPVLFDRRYEEITDNLYGYKVQRHIIFYRIVIDDEIEIIRILHERMDIKNKFGI